MKKTLIKNLIVFAATILLTAAFATAAYADEIVPEGQVAVEQAQMVQAEPTDENIAEGQASTEASEPVLAELTTGPMSYYETETYESEYGAAARVALINYARQFCGCPYRWGGTNPLTGCDCSGFVLHCVNAVAGLDFPHSSRAQAGYGYAVTYEQLTPGDLVFYATGSRIDHVAIYIGGDLVVHAANERKGVLVSSLWHRTPVLFTSIF